MRGLVVIGLFSLVVAWVEGDLVKKASVLLDFLCVEIVPELVVEASFHTDVFGPARFLVVSHGSPSRVQLLVALNKDNAMAKKRRPAWSFYRRWM